MDWSERLKLLCIFIGSIMSAILLIAVLVIPIMYLDGRAKSRWIKETKGIDMPWYEATHLNVQVNSIDADVSSR
jgi:hypothetical protein